MIKPKLRRLILYFILILVTAIALITIFPITTPHNLALQAVVVPDNLSNTIPLTGKWQFVAESPTSKQTEESTLELKPSPNLPDLSNQKWQDINVPANWWLEGQDLSGVVWYRHSFPAIPELQNKVVKLAFSGVDYAADVWLNGHYLGFHEGYFQPFDFLVAKYLNPTGDNILTVRVNSPLEIQTQDWSLHKRLVKGILAHHDARPGSAWTDRGQEQNTGGIWDTVALHVSEKVAIDGVQVTPKINLDCVASEVFPLCSA